MKFSERRIRVLVRWKRAELFFALILASYVSIATSAIPRTRIERPDSSALSAKEVAPIIYAVKVVGNRVTRSDFILREMDLKPGVAATPELIESDRLHLLSTGLFNQVEISVTTDMGRAVVLVRLTERFYFLPYPIFLYDAKDPSRRVLGLTLSHDNFRGYGERLTAGWWDGYEHGFMLIHGDPWFSFRGIYGLRSELFVNNVESTDSDGKRYRAKVESFLLRLERRIDRQRWIGLETEWAERTSRTYAFTSHDRDRLISGRLLYESDQRDYKYYPSRGYYVLGVMDANRMVDTTHTFFGERIDLQTYKSVHPFIFALKVSAHFTQNKLPYYRQAELTQYEVRSDEPLNLLGSRSFVANFETRFNLIPLRHYSLPDIPLAGPYLQKLKFSVEGFFFIDHGFLTVSDPPHNVAMAAYGCGLQFQLPYIEIASAAFGWSAKNPLRKPAIILQTDVTF
jgi:outer membrane protein assembly factor BamA